MNTDIKSLIIAISGCGGGTSGPGSLYHSLEEKYAKRSDTRFLPIETIPDDLMENILRVSDLVHAQLAHYQHIYLMGYSMGGGVAAITAAELNSERPGTIKGVILLNSQTEGLQALNQLSVPVVFIHGRNDAYFPIEEIRSCYDRYRGPKKLVLIDGMDHNCRFDWFKRVDLLNITSNLLNQLPNVEAQEIEFTSNHCTIS